MRHYVFLLVLGIPLILAQTCGTPAPIPDDGGFDRLAVNDTLRAACDGFTFPSTGAEYADPDIRAFLNAVEVDRKAGISEYTETNLMLDLCTQYPSNAQFVCGRCYTAIVTQVYSE